MRIHAVRSLRLVVGVACLAIMAVPGQAVVPSDASETIESRIAADFEALKSAVAAARQALQTLDGALGGLAAGLVERPAPSGDGGGAVAQLEPVRAGVRAREEALGRLQTYLGLVGQWEDAAHEIEAVASRLGNDGVERAAAVIASLPAAVRDAPEVAAALDRCRKALAALVATVAPLRDGIAAMRERGRLGGDERGGVSDPLYQQLIKQVGDPLAHASIYVPSSPPEFYRPRVKPAERGLDVALLWDEAGTEWIRLPPDVPTEDVFRDAYLATGHRPTPGQLKYLATNYRQVMERRAASEGLAAQLRAADGQSEGSALGTDDKLQRVMREPWLFRAKYVYDGDFRASVHTALDRLRRALVAQGQPAQAKLAALDAMLDRYGIVLDSQWAAGVLPAVGSVRVTAWFDEAPQTRFSSLWRFDKEHVKVEIEQGYATGLRRGNTVQTEGSIPGRNCTAVDHRTFAEGGKLTFSTAYSCQREDGTLETSNRTGAGTWELLAENGGPAAVKKPLPAKPARRTR